jgi:histidyl-tRNA synthetase
MLRRVKGTRDIFSEDFSKQDLVVRTSWNIAKCYGFVPISTPILEHTETFAKTLGEGSDVVRKEMYSFLDRGGDNLTLRPELTASIMRAVHCLNMRLPARLFTHGAVFRRERPQAGRYRQFHQADFECVGFKGPFIDAELVKLAYEILRALQIDSKVTLKVNSLGCRETRASYQIALTKYLKAHEFQLSEENVTRLVVNPLRVLDSSQDREIIDSAPSIEQLYTPEAASEWRAFTSYLDLYDLKYEVDHKLVRGLDYYNGPVFEFVPKSLGSQSVVIGGGRYDGLAEIMYGKTVPAVGCALGIERIALLLEDEIQLERPLAVLLPVEERHIELCLQLSCKLRQDICRPLLVEVEGKLSARMKKASLFGACYAVFIGDNEAQSALFKLRNLDSGEEKLLDYNLLLKELTNSD